MIDLISDTVTLPSREMLEAVLEAKLGDAGRLDSELRGEDAATNELEDMAAELTGFEAAMFCPSGTCANSSAVLSCAGRGEKVLMARITCKSAHKLAVSIVSGPLCRLPSCGCFVERAQLRATRQDLRDIQRFVW